MIGEPITTKRGNVRFEWMKVYHSFATNQTAAAAPIQLILIDVMFNAADASSEWKDSSRSGGHADASDAPPRLLINN